MKKIYAIKEKIFLLLAAVVFCTAGLVLLINFNNIVWLMILGYAFIVITIVILIKLFAFLNHIIISNNRIIVFNYPFFATNKFFEEKKLDFMEQQNQH